MRMSDNDPMLGVHLNHGCVAKHLVAVCIGGGLLVPDIYG